MEVLRRLRADGGRDQLLVRFGLITAASLALFGVVISVLLSATIHRRAVANAEGLAVAVGRLTVDALVDSHLRPSLSRQARTPDAAGSDVGRLRVFTREGELIHSEDTRAIGRIYPLDGDLASALAGSVTSRLDLHSELSPTSGAVLRVHAPVLRTTASGGDEVIGVFELVLDFDPIAASTATSTRWLILAVAVGLAGLWVVSYHVVATASKRLGEQSRHNEWLAHHDRLTRLPNRALFTSRLSRAVTRARRTGASVGVLIVDIQRFQEINDTLGHTVGDAVLRQMGGRLARPLREVDTVARLGGDEFAVLLPDVGDLDSAVDVAERVVDAVRYPVQAGAVSAEVACRVGVAVFPDDGLTPQRLMQSADVALKAAKSSKVDVARYAPEHDDHTPTRLALYGDLRRAVEKRELVLHYQPKVTVADGTVAGVEALLRWRHPERGLLYPDAFIDLAEQTGLMAPLTNLVLEEAVTQCAAWRRQDRRLSVAVNLSTRSLLDRGLPQRIAELLRQHALPADALELEITETTALVDPGRAIEVLGALAELGVKLSVDDYGTGHASLSYLASLPVDCLKIDRSFVMVMDDHPREATIVRSTIDLARNLGLSVVAEGVETEAAYRQLRALGCEGAQGYWLSRPVSADRIPAVIDGIESRLLSTAPRAA